MHHRVSQRALVREMPVDRALVHTRTLGDRTERQRSPVPDGRSVEQRGACGDDPLARPGGLLAAQRGVVAPARLSWCTHASLADQPPSTGMTAPVTNEARSD